MPKVFKQNLNYWYLNEWLNLMSYYTKHENVCDNMPQWVCQCVFILCECWHSCVCECVGCLSEMLGWGMKVWWWCRSLRTDSQNTWINWSTSVWLPSISNTLYLGFTSLSSSHVQSCCVFVDEPCVTLCVVCDDDRIMMIWSDVSLNTWSGCSRWMNVWKLCTWTRLDLCRSVFVKLFSWCVINVSQVISAV